LEQALRLLKRGGSCVLVGVPEEAATFNVLSFVIGELQIHGSVSGTRRDLQDAIRVFSSEGLRTVTQTIKLEDVNVATEMVANGKASGRVVLTIP
jgi:alcohol dehydrogenase, propanol-preferring